MSVDNQERLYNVEAFDPSWEIDPVDIARIHLGIRQWQVRTGNNTFSNVYDSQNDLAGLDEYYIMPSGNFFVARNPQGDPIGFIGLRNDGEGHGTIKRLAVVPEYQGNRIGLALATEAVTWAAENGFEKLALQTGPKERAKPIYEKLGFVVVGILARNNDWLMELDLSTTG